jgi:hypothetical protein
MNHEKSYNFQLPKTWLLSQYIDLEVIEQTNSNLRSHIHGITLVIELHLLNYWTLSTKIQIIQIQIICMHIIHICFMLNCG